MATLAPDAIPAEPSPAAVGIYLGGVQFLFALGWVIYALYLPQLAVQAGIGKAAVIWLLMLDQLIFLFCDLAMGVAADRLGRVVGRIGWTVLALTLVSSVAFLLLPVVAPQASPALFLALTVIWAATSSALRAPPLTLIGRHAAQPSRPALVAWSMFGLGLAGALAPYVGLVLRHVDPRLPFALSAAVLALATAGIVLVERRLATGALARPANPVPTYRPNAVAPLLMTLLFAALAFQGHAFLNSGGFFLRHVDAAQLPVLMPLFWVAFNLGLWPGTLLTRRWGAVPVMLAGAVLAATAAAVAAAAPSLGILIAAQLLAGAGWAAVLASAFTLAVQAPPTGRPGMWAGALSSMLALAALTRMAVVAAGGAADPALADVRAWWPALGWLIATGGLVVLWRKRSDNGAR